MALVTVDLQTVVSRWRVQRVRWVGEQCRGWLPEQHCGVLACFVRVNFIGHERLLDACDLFLCMRTVRQVAQYRR